MSKQDNGEHQMGRTSGFADTFPTIETIAQLRGGLAEAGARETDRLFSLCPNPDDCADALVDDTRYFFYEQSDEDDESYHLAVDSEIPVLPRAKLPASNFLSAVEVPLGAKPLSRLLLAVDPVQGITVGDLFERLGHLLHEIDLKTGRMPADISLDHIAYHGEEDSLYLVPPLAFAEGQDAAGLLGRLGAELDSRNHNIDSATALRRFQDGMAA